MSEAVKELIDIVIKLRSDNGCDWDRKQTSESLTPHLIEEANEVVDAVLEKNSEEDLSLFGLRNTASNEMNLLSQQKSVDYFLIIENIANKTYVDKVLKKISEISGVITSFISKNRLENKENLIFS